MGVRRSFDLPENHSSQDEVTSSGTALWGREARSNSSTQVFPQHQGPVVCALTYHGPGAGGGQRGEPPHLPTLRPSHRKEAALERSWYLQRNRQGRKAVQLYTPHWDAVCLLPSA